MALSKDENSCKYIAYIASSPLMLFRYGEGNGAMYVILEHDASVIGNGRKTARCESPYLKVYQSIFYCLFATILVLFGYFPVRCRYKC